MIFVDFDPARLTGDDARWWKNWSARASKARAKAIEDREAKRGHKFQSAVWSDLKEWLIARVFHGKCAYCESPVELTGFGDAEHFRPKARVTILVNGKVQTVQIDGRDHPGYYWLAYEWRNLFPACSQCNTAGKMNHFPVAKTHVIRHDPAREDPDALDSLEEPLLLNPYKDRPQKHIRFGEMGIVTAIDDNPRGKQSIDTYRLMRGALVSARQKAQELVWIKYLDEVKRANGSARLILEPYIQGTEPYSQAVVDYIRLKVRQLNDEMTGLGV